MSAIQYVGGYAAAFEAGRRQAMGMKTPTAEQIDRVSEILCQDCFNFLDEAPPDDSLARRVRLAALFFDELYPSEMEMPAPRVDPSAFEGAPARQEEMWCDPALSDGDFRRIRVKFPGVHCTWEDVGRIGQCLGYALAQHLAGEGLGGPTSVVQSPSGTVIHYTWSADSSIRTEPDYSKAMLAAREYIFGGTPIRTTDRQGPGTKGTQLVKGVGFWATIEVDS